MTSLNRAITRRTELDPRLGRKAAGAVSVTLYPDATIGFRKLKCRTEFRLPLAAVYSLAMKAAAAKERAEKKARRK
jgi:hypothetical protein